MYRYNCRKCPIRNRCIDESENSPSVKEMIRHAFEARTDTLKVWDRLQRNCLLVKAEQERSRQAPGESLLSRRLRETRENKQTETESGANQPSSSPDYLRPVKLSGQTPKLKPLASWDKSKQKSTPAPETRDISTPPPETKSPDWLPKISSPTGSRYTDVRPEMIGEATPPPPKPQPLQKVAPARPHWLTVGKTGRHIVVPTDSELVLGRFDPDVGVPPDIDLSYEDEGDNTVSRRHAKIIGQEGYHKIEDLGSRLGVFINGKRVEVGRLGQLKSGDRIALGQVSLLYDAIPTHLLLLSPTDQMRHVITVTPTGRRLTIAPPNEIRIGRVDTYVGFVPDIDLGQDGVVSSRVSRSHAAITWRKNIPYIEDMGSGFGTRLNGMMLLMGQAVRLNPGDHIWLGGCVLAYDVEL